jgi:flagellar hook-associated protein 1 FlgK
MSLEAALLRATAGIRHTARQMEATSQNVANASVEGYTRKTVKGEQTASGVRSAMPQRDVDRALRSEARSARGEAASASLRAQVLGPLSELQGSPADGASVGGRIGALRDRLSELRANPNDTAAQGEALGAAEDLAAQLKDVAGAVTRARQSAQDGLRADVDNANALLRGIAALDNQARALRSAGLDDGVLLDRRDAAIGQLSELIGVTPAEGSRGELTLILQGGAVLPLDEKGSPLSIGDAVVAPGSYYGPPDGTLPGLELNGVRLADVPRGGRIGAGLELRDETLPRMTAELDTLAATMAGRLRDQGLALFTEPGGAAPPAPGSAAAIGFASRVAVNPAVKAAPAALRDGTAGIPGFPPNPDGQAGYTKLLDRVLDFAFGAQRAAGVPHAAIPGTGLGPGGALSSAFSPPRALIDYAAAMTASHAKEAAVAGEEKTATATLSTRINALVQGREGVEVDAEMAAMVTLQNAYAANARVISSVQAMWDALMGMVR